MPSLVPHTQRNAVRSTRSALPQSPADIYVPPIDVCGPLACASAPPPASIETGVYIPPFDEDCNPIDHTLPHKDPPASFVEAACEAAAEFVEELEDNTSEDGHVNLEHKFDDLVGNEESDLDDLSYSSNEDDEDYDDDMEEEARLIECSDVKKRLRWSTADQLHSRWTQTTYILWDECIGEGLGKSGVHKEANDTHVGCE
jgi:hypothetical protein